MKRYRVDCLLFRHGIAVERGEWKGKEHERPLTEKGKKRVQLAAAGLRAIGMAPTQILTSPLTRAHETAKLLQAKLRPQTLLIVCDELSPGISPDKFVSLLASLPPGAVVVCVGHEPSLSEVAGVVLSGRPVAGFAMKKAGACLIHFPETAKAARGILQWWVTPSQLRALGKTKVKRNHSYE